MKVDGGCHCGNIRYEAEVDPAKVVICHCTDCQTLSGTAFRTVVPTSEGTFKLLAGSPRPTSRPARAATSACRRSARTAARRSTRGPPGEGAKVVGLRVGTIRQRDQLVPGDQYWFRSALAWLARPAGRSPSGTSNPCSTPRAASAADCQRGQISSAVQRSRRRRADARRRARAPLPANLLLGFRARGPRGPGRHEETSPR